MSSTAWTSVYCRQRRSRDRQRSFSTKDAHRTAFDDCGRALARLGFPGSSVDHEPTRAGLLTTTAGMCLRTLGRYKQADQAYRMAIAHPDHQPDETLAVRASTQRGQRRRVSPSVAHGEAVGNMPLRSAASSALIARNRPDIAAGRVLKPPARPVAPKNRPSMPRKP